MVRQLAGGLWFDSLSAVAGRGEGATPVRRDACCFGWDAESTVYFHMAQVLLVVFCLAEASINHHSLLEDEE